MFFLTTLILASLVALPEAALAFLKFLSSSLSFSMLARMAFESPSLILAQTFFSTMIMNQLLKYQKMNNTKNNKLPFQKQTQSINIYDGYFDLYKLNLNFYIKNLMISFQITMPLKIGLNELNQREGAGLRDSFDFTISSKDYSICLDLVLSHAFLKRQTGKTIDIENLKDSTQQNIRRKYIKPSCIIHEQNRIQLSQFCQVNGRQNTAIQCVFDGEEELNTKAHSQFGIFNPLLSFVLKSENQSTIKLNLSKKNLTFNFKQIKKAKLVNNQKLRDIILNEENQISGVLSMDQAGRFLVQDNQCKFPTVGIWEKTIGQIDSNLSLKNYSTFDSVYRYLTSKKYTKCRFNHSGSGQYYLYYAKFISQEEIPLLFLVSWKQGETERLTFAQKVVSAYGKGNIQVRIPSELQIQTSGMQLQFTLRDPNRDRDNSKSRKVGESTKTSLKYCSPIKEINNFDLESQLQKSEQECRERQRQNQNQSFKSDYNKGNVESSPEFKFNKVNFNQETPKNHENTLNDLSEIKAVETQKANQRYAEYERYDKATLVKKIMTKDNQIDFLKTQINRLKNALKILSQSSNKKGKFLKSPCHMLSSRKVIQKNRLSESDLNGTLLSSTNFKGKMDILQSPIVGQTSWQQRNKIYDQFQVQQDKEDCEYDYFEHLQIVQQY